MIQYPVTFSAKINATDKINTLWSSKDSTQQSFSCCIPPEFEGPGGGVSPEDFFALALSNCLVATFKVYAHHSKLSFEKLELDSKLIVDKDEQQKPVMKECHMQAVIRGASNADLAKRLLERALSSGFILNSVKTKLSLQIEVA